MANGSNGPSDLIHSVSRALRILEVAGSDPRGLNAKQLARRCELPLSTTYHLLRTLCYEGYLVRRRGGAYVIGYEIAGRFRDLAHALQQPPEVREVLRHLASVTGHSAYLSRLIDGKVVITEVVEAPRSPKVEDLIVGFSEAAHATALGKSLLWAMPRSTRRAYLAEQGMWPVTSETVTDTVDLEAELSALGRAGLFIEEAQFRAGVSCLAVLVRNQGSNQEYGSIAFSAESGRFDEIGRFLAAELRLAASDLEGRSLTA
ncbi:MAG: helix-turn-helix domain-containing protein [Actinobacteria bacterium]|nr:helix-turn-helix domain-containing protein [Actinomycetota bacterium]